VKSINFYLKCVGWLYGVFLLASCARKTVPLAPEEYYGRVEIPTEISTLVLPIELPVSSIQKKLNEQVKGVLFEENKLNTEHYLVKVWKASDIIITPNNDQLLTRIPLKVYAKAAFDVLGKEASQETNFELAIKLSTRLQLDPSWKI
jgi:hypothetical protein